MLVSLATVSSLVVAAGVAPQVRLRTARLAAQAAFRRAAAEATGAGQGELQVGAAQAEAAQAAQAQVLAVWLVVEALLARLVAQRVFRPSITTLPA